MLSVAPSDISHIQVWKYLLAGVAPRPIALVSTISPEGVNNLSPFSFFNAFGSNPPVVAFSPSRRGKDNTTKDTYHNIVETKECVIQAVTYQMLHQMNLSSCDFPPEIDEFVKSGFTPVDSDFVKPKRVKESPFQMECKLIHLLELGGKHGSGNLAVCEIIKFHIAEYILKNGDIDPQLIDHIARNGADYYTHAAGEALFKVQKPGSLKGIGFDLLPEYIKSSDVYTANNLGRFALVESYPGPDEVLEFITSYPIIESDVYAFNKFLSLRDYRTMLSVALFLKGRNHNKLIHLLELTAKCALEQNDIDFAWRVAVFTGITKHK